MNKVFDWARIGDVQMGRGNLGDSMPVAVYRLMQYTIRDELIDRFGIETAEEITRAAGHRAGFSFAQNNLVEKDDFYAFIAELQQKLKEFSIGVLRIERADLDSLKLTLTVSEDLDCSGLPVTGETVCAYDEGFIAGILESFTGKQFNVIEIDCWATGDRTCRFTAEGKL